MNKFATVTGRRVQPYEYYGVQDADRSSCCCMRYYRNSRLFDFKREKVGAVKYICTDLLLKYFLAEIPSSVQKIAVLDGNERTRCNW